MMVYSAIDPRVLLLARKSLANFDLKSPPTAYRVCCFAVSNRFFFFFLNVDENTPFEKCAFNVFSTETRWFFCFLFVCV